MDSASTLARSVSEGNPESNATHPRLRHGLVSGFGDLACRITAWTTNLLATAIVLAGGLAMGWQVLAWWHERTQPNAAGAMPAEAALPPIAEGREFWTRGGPLRIEIVSGNREAAMKAMSAYCRDHSSPLGGGSLAMESRATAGPGEAQFVASLSQQTPLETA